LLVLALAACESPSGNPERQPPPPPASASAPVAAQSAAPPTTASAAAPSGLGGTWTGRYEAKKSTISLPAKVKDKGLASDDGKAASGPGTVELTVGPGGEVRGKVLGALGTGAISGKVEEQTLRATINPVDWHAPNAMTGVIVGRLEGNVIRARIDVAGPDATVVREAQVDLERK
jgi:hypothetical protein